MRTASPGTLWSRSDLRARAVSLVVLGVLAGLTIGLATAAFDGARRTDSALTRLQERTNASDAVVFAQRHRRHRRHSDCVDCGECAGDHSCAPSLEGAARVGAAIGVGGE